MVMTICKASLRLGNRHIIAGAVLLSSLIGCLIGPRAALAEVQNYTNAASGLDVTWTNCPTRAAYDGQLCNYTVAYAGTGTTFQRFIIIALANFADLY